MAEYILGLNAFHGDSSACLFYDGKLIAAVEEERFRRVKHWAGFPSESIKYCLSVAGITLSDISHIAINQNIKSNFSRKLIYSIYSKFSLKLVIDRIKNKGMRLNIRRHLELGIPDQEFRGDIHQIEHHLSHIASAFYVSPYSKAAVLSVDGFGDFASTAWGVGNGIDIDVDDKIFFPHSLGIFYQALTQFLGFNNYGDEYKIMGLAPYGRPRFLSEMEKIVLLLPGGRYKLNLKYFLHQLGGVKYEWDGKCPVIGRLFSHDLEGLLGKSRDVDSEITQVHMDIASSIQAMYEKALFHILNSMYLKYGIDDLALAGGCAMNSVANGKIQKETPFKRVYIQSAAGDSGGAIGAALSVFYSMRKNYAGTRREVHDHAYWGPEFTNEQIKHAIYAYKDDLSVEKYSIHKENNFQHLCDQIASEVSNGNVVGWFQGRLEWGPRALGNRSIIGDPRRENMKEILNSKIKRRESFRPFAPSILRESVVDWFETDGDVPFMMQVFQIREEMRGKIPAVTHVDGSGRLQTVCEKNNPKYYQLIKAFYRKTGVPILLNTSFNENEPVVCSPEEAIDCFVRTKMDILVLGEWILKRI